MPSAVWQPRKYFHIVFQKSCKLLWLFVLFSAFSSHRCLLNLCLKHSFPKFTPVWNTICKKPFCTQFFHFQTQSESKVKTLGAVWFAALTKGCGQVFIFWISFSNLKTKSNLTKFDQILIFIKFGQIWSKFDFF